MIPVAHRRKPVPWGRAGSRDIEGGKGFQGFAGFQGFGKKPEALDSRLESGISGRGLATRQILLPKISDRFSSTPPHVLRKTHRVHSAQDRKSRPPQRVAAIANCQPVLRSLTGTKEDCRLSTAAVSPQHSLAHLRPGLFDLFLRKSASPLSRTKDSVAGSGTLAVVEILSSSM